MIELTIKTLDSQNHHFTVPHDYTVEQLKGHIADTIQIPSDSQRCIYLGQVLQNDVKLSDCDVNGKVIHVVQRPPPTALYNSENQNGADGNNYGPSGTPPTRRFETHGTMYLGAMTLPSDFLDTGGFTFLHPRTNLSGSRLAVARNLLRRAINIIDQLGNANYFDSNLENGSQPQPSAANGSLNDDMGNENENNGFEQSDVEIRIELPNSQNDVVGEALIDSIPEPPETPLMNGTSEQSTVSGSSGETSSRSQNDGEGSVNGTAREDGTRRRNSRAPLMATVMGAVLHAQVRLIPYMRLLRQYLLQDTAFGADMHTTHTEQQIQTLFNSVSESMHYFSHIYHSLSDIMCDFSQPPPRTLRCRPVIIQQPQAHVFRASRPRGTDILRPPTWGVSRSTSTNSTAESDPIVNGTLETSPAVATASAAATVANHDAGSSTVEVVIEEADTTNVNSDEGISESMDTSEPSAPPSTDQNGVSGASNVAGPHIRVHNSNGNTLLIQSMPEGLLPDGIHINSIEANILTPSEGITTTMSGGASPRWRPLPPDVLQNMFGFLRQTQRPPRPGGQQASNTAPNAPEGNQRTTGVSSNANTNGEASMAQNNTTSGLNSPQERSIELDIRAMTQTFDPFLLCHSHHINPVVSRVSGLRNGAVRGSNSSATTGQSSQSQQNSQDAVGEQRNTHEIPAQPASVSADQRQSQQSNTTRNEDEGAFFIPPDMPRTLSNLFSNILPGLNLDNMMFRRGSADGSNVNSESDTNNQGRLSARARIHVTSNLNAVFPGAIQIEIDPLTNNVQTSFMSNDESQQTDANAVPRRTRTASRRIRRTPGANNEPSESGSAAGSFATTSDCDATLELSSSSDEEIDRMARIIRTRKDKNIDAKLNKTIKYMYSLVRSESTSPIEKNGVDNYPLYVENQDASLLDVVNTVLDNTSFEEIVRNSETNVEYLTVSIREKLKKFVTDRTTIISGNKSSLLNAVNVLINNDLHRLKNILDSGSVKQEIDLVSTICKFNHDSVPKLIVDIVQAGELSKAGGVYLRRMFSSYIARLMLLFLHCLTGNDKSPHIKKILAAVVDEFIKNLPSDKNLIRWLRKDLINLVIAYSKICNPDNLPANMRHFVVYRLPPAVPVECTVATATITNIRDSDIAPERAQPMDVEEAVQSTSSSSSESSFVSAHSDVTQATIEKSASTTTASSNGPAPVIPVPEVVLSSEEWHRSIPSEWVPIITRDIHRLRRQGRQPPFSDAYLSGMPTKRRKLVKNSKPDLQENGRKLISDNISTAMAAAGFSESVNSITNGGTEDNADDRCLSEMVKEELKENVRENIVQQQDFLPNRFPDSSKYFMDK